MEKNLKFLCVVKVIANEYEILSVVGRYPTRWRLCIIIEYEYTLHMTLFFYSYTFL